jgi:hypothetical protein
VHEPRLLDRWVCTSVSIVFDALNETARAVANADDADPDFRHSRFPLPLARMLQLGEKARKTRHL